METCRVYLSGGMGNLSFEEQSKWRKQVINAILYGDYHYEKKPIFFNPVDYYNFTDVRYKSEREVMQFDLNALRHSDLVIVNFNDPKSLGTCAELAIAYEMKIPIIGINKDDVLIAISFPRYSKSVKNAVEFAKNSGADVIALTDTEESPIAASANQLLLAQSDMASFVDSLVAPLSIINALVVAVAKKKQSELKDRLSQLEQIWDEYDVYDKF